MKELLEQVRAVLEYTGPSRKDRWIMGTAGEKLTELEGAVEAVLESGLYNCRVEARDLLDVPGCH